MVRSVAHLTIAIALLTVFLAPTGLADHRPACQAATAEEPGAPVYVHERRGDAELWEETNDVPGLQRVSCTDEEGEHRPQDTKVMHVGQSDVDEVVDLIWSVERLVCDLYNSPTPPSFQILCPHELI